MLLNNTGGNGGENQQLPAPVAGTVVVGTLANAGSCDVAFANPANLTAMEDGGAYGWAKTVVTKGTKKLPPDPFTATVVGVDTQALAALPLGLSSLGDLEDQCSFGNAVSFGAASFADGTFE